MQKELRQEARTPAFVVVGGWLCLWKPHADNTGTLENPNPRRPSLRGVFIKSPRGPTRRLACCFQHASRVVCHQARVVCHHDALQSVAAGPRAWAAVIVVVHRCECEPVRRRAWRRELTSRAAAREQHRERLGRRRSAARGRERGADDVAHLLYYVASHYIALARDFRADGAFAHHSVERAVELDFDAQLPPSETVSNPHATRQHRRRRCAAVVGVATPPSPWPQHHTITRPPPSGHHRAVAAPHETSYASDSDSNRDRDCDSDRDSDCDSDCHSDRHSDCHSHCGTPPLMAL